MDRQRLDGILRAQLTQTLDATELGELGDKYEGKVRDNYVGPAPAGGGEERRRVIVVSDRVSTFDVVVGTIPFKGQVLNQMAQYWFEQTRDVVPNHLLDVPDPNVMVVKECVPLQAEFVMRSYLTGVTSTSIWSAYERGERSFCGHALADGMSKNQRLPHPILTPSTKAAKGGHDMSVSREQLIEMGHITPEHFERAAEIASTLFEFGVRRAAERGLVLVDTKYEMGIDAAGDIVVIDEIHTPDSSRYWHVGDLEQRIASGQEPRSLDKEFVRRWLVETHGYRGDGAPPPLTDEVRIEAAHRYIELYELVTGGAFEPDTENPTTRLARNLGLAG